MPEYFFTIYTKEFDDTDDDDDDNETETEADDEENGEEEEKLELPIEEEEEPLKLQKINALKLETAGKCLSLLCKTATGLEYAFIKMEANQLNVEDISILSNFPHLRYLDISDNKIQDITSIGVMKYLLLLKASSNRIVIPDSLKELKFLQHLDLSSNMMTRLSSLVQPYLKTVNLSDNQITQIGEIEVTALSCLTVLDLRGNKLTNTIGMQGIPSLKELYLGSNDLIKLFGFEDSVHLERLHLRDNLLAKLRGLKVAPLPALKYINFRDNHIEDFETLRYIKHLSSVEAIVFTGNPLREEGGYRVRVLSYLPNLLRIDKELVDEEERSEGREIAKERLEEGGDPDDSMETIILPDEEYYGEGEEGEYGRGVSTGGKETEAEDDDDDDDDEDDD